MNDIEEDDFFLSYSSLPYWARLKKKGKDFPFEKAEKKFMEENVAIWVNGKLELLRDIKEIKEIGEDKEDATL